ncbi:MAG: DUF92 domain-containing protein [Planctomycetes bacterium]|nr:DUF92 domain-containing protein [Planctomycetota bacterium]
MDPNDIRLILVVNVAFGALAFFARTVGRSGLLAGVMLGSILWWIAGWQGWCVLFLFFIIGSGLTKFKAGVKESRGIAEASGGRRGARNALAKVMPGLLAAWCAALFTDPASAWNGIWHVAFVATFATAAADTAGTEVGKAIGRTPILLTSFRRVAPGTIGAVSVEGTAAGIVAAVALAVFGALAKNYYQPFDPWKGASVVVAAAFLGNVFESWMNAFMVGRKKLDHELSNFLLCVAGGAAALGMCALFRL